MAAYANIWLVLLGTVLLGMMAGAVGCFLLLRRRALIADALGHATLPGIAAAAFIGASLGFSSLPWWMMFVAALCSTGLALLAIRALGQRYVPLNQLSEDTALAVVLSLSFSLGLLIMSALPMLSSPVTSGLSALVFGQAAVMQGADVIGIAVAALVVMGALRFYAKDLSLVAFDPAYAASVGLPVARIDALLLLLATLVTITALPAVGLILVVALLIIPAATARLWCLRLRPMLLCAAFVGGLSAVGGVIASFILPHVPAGAAIILCAFGCFMVSLMAAPKRSVQA